MSGFLSPWYFCQLTDGLWYLHWAQWWPQLPETESSGLVQKEMKNKSSSYTAFCFKGFLKVHKTTRVLWAKRGRFGANNFTSTTGGLSCHNEFSAFGGHCVASRFYGAITILLVTQINTWGHLKPSDGLCTPSMMQCQLNMPAVGRLSHEPWC